MKFTVVGRDDCPWCKEATDLLSKTPYEYEYFNITERSHPLRFFLKSLGLNTVPQIWFGDELIGGYTDLKDHIDDSTQLDLFYDEFLRSDTYHEAVDLKH